MGRPTSGVLLGASLFGLAPCGVLPATRVTTSAVRSYRTFSPLPAIALSGSGRRYVFCATFLQVTLTGRYPAHCPAEFGLSSPPPRLRATPRRSSGSLRRCNCTSWVWRNANRSAILPVALLRDLVLLQLLVQIAA